MTLTIERPAAGGRMIARHEGAIVFVAGGIPGEMVEAVVEKVQRGTVWAATDRVVEAVAGPGARRRHRLRRVPLRPRPLRAPARAQGRDHRGRVPPHRAHAPRATGGGRRVARRGLPHAGASPRARRPRGLLPRRHARVVRCRADAATAGRGGRLAGRPLDGPADARARNRVGDRALREHRRLRARLPPRARAAGRPVAPRHAQRGGRPDRRVVRAARASADDGVVGKPVGVGHAVGGRAIDDARVHAPPARAVVLPGEPLPAGRRSWSTCWRTSSTAP